ncbi:MAG: chromosome segregation protein SMC, partial [Planctomycetota bacterium]|nr:chromosome segregation protein SMC [Planctomycetota bacterium]
MRLKRLELFGFKSFADRTVLEFDAGVTGIVGPNGCGKSNVVDAVRWVLGERRPTSMRGAEMTDVIFKGSASRPAMSVAEVSLVLENECGTLEGHGAEVSITRRVFKSGEGEYLVDGQKVRLKDVKDMMFDTGLGSRGYAILEQGKIDAVLSADALERRSIFEEAAGISRFRQRKKEAESRLKAVDRDMTRLEDVVRELERRQRSLKIQAGKAERYVEAKEAWTTEGSRYARHRFARLTEDLSSLGEELTGLEARAAELRALREAAEGDVNAREHEQLALTAELERLSAEATEVAGDLRALDERRNQLSSRIGSWKESAASELDRATGLEVRTSEREAELDQSQRRVAELEAKAAAAEAELGRMGTDNREAFERFKEARAAFAAQNDLVLGLLHDKNRAQNSKRHLEASLEPLSARAGRGAERLTEARTNLVGAREQLAADTQGLEEARVSAVDLAARRDELREAGQAARQAARERGAEQQRLDLEVKGLTSRVESLLDWSHEREGLDAGSLAILDQRESLGLGESALAGIVADHLRCETHHAAALEAVLGHWAEALVLAEPERAVDLMEWLRREEAGFGRLAMAAPTLAGGDFAPDLADLAGRPGVLGRLRDCVSPTAGYEGLADRLVGGVLLVADLQTAKAVIAERPELLCVTLAGDLCSAAALAGGAGDGRGSGAVARRAQAAARESELVVRPAEATAAAEAAAAAELRVAGLEAELGAAVEGAQEARARSVRLESAVRSGERRVRDLEEAAEVLEGEAQKLVEERSRIEAELAENQRVLDEVQGRFDLENAQLDELESRRKELEGRRDDTSRAEAAARVEWTRLSGELTGEKRRGEHLTAALAETQAELARTRSLSSEHAKSAVEGADEFERLGAERSAKLAERGDLDERLGTLRAKDRDGREAVDELRRRADAVTRELEGLMDATAKRQLERQRIDLSREELLRRSDEELDLTLDDLCRDFEAEPELAEEGALDVLQTEVAELKRALDRLGPVNLAAVEELAEVTERLDFLVAQRKDLAESRQSLMATIAKIDEESERLFLEAFAEIKGNFQAIFRKLFGGGKADIILDPDLPPLEAGIEIYARPPGRENLPIGLLSGGQRTMIALALLFAVFEARPSPFCMLDEVDAALDDANIERFLTM